MVLLLVVCDYMSTASNCRSAVGHKSFLAFVVQVLNLDDGVRQRADWTFFDQVDGVRGKKPICSQQRMEPRLLMAGKSLEGKDVVYNCPRKGN